MKTPSANQIAKKHKKSLSSIIRQIKNGAKIEAEHTKSAKAASEIARDHINERPDYYKKLKKMEKSKRVSIGEENLTGEVRGLGYVSGDPAGTLSGTDKYINTNTMAYDGENGFRFNFLKKQHIDLHNNNLGYTAFDPTKIGAMKNFNHLQENKLNELGDFVKDGTSGYEGTSALSPRALRKNDMKEQGPVYTRYSERPTYEGKDRFSSTEVDRGIYENKKRAVVKLKKAARAGLTAASLYTLGDVAGRSAEGIGSPSEDIVKMSSTARGPVGYVGMAADYTNKYGKKVYNYLKDKLQKEDMKNPCWKGYKAIGMKTKNGKKVPNCVPSESNINEGSIDRELENDQFINTVSREANLRDPKSIDAVLNVMRNRMGQKGYGSTPLGVVSQKGQFAGYGKGPAKGFNDEIKNNILNRAKAIFSGKEKDITDGANEFRTTSSKNLPGGVVIGGNTFYKRGAAAKTNTVQPSSDETKMTPKPDNTSVTNTPSPTSMPNSTSIDSDINKLSSTPVKPANQNNQELSQMKKASINELFDTPKGKEKGKEYIHRAAQHLYQQGRNYEDESKRRRNLESNPALDAPGKQGEKVKGMLDRTMKNLERIHRKTSARTVGIPRAAARLAKEEAQINEMGETEAGREKLMSYQKKAYKQVMDKDTPEHTKFKRAIGLHQAAARYVKGKKLKEEVMDTKDLINDAIQDIMEENYISMKDNFQQALQEKALEKLEERKKEIAANYFAQ